MIATESTDVLDPERRSFHRTLGLTPEDFGRLHDAFFVRLVSQDLVNVGEQLVGAEVAYVHRQTETFVIEASGVVKLVAEHRKSDHGNPMVDGLVLSVVAAVGDE